MHVGLLACDGCFSSGLTALIDVLSTAHAQRPRVDPSIPPIRIDVIGTGRTVTTGAGLTVPVTMHLRDLPAADVVVVPALGTMTAEDTLSALAARTSRAIIRALGGLDPEVTTVAAACTGVFTLAESGLLDRRRATTSWWLGAAFRSRYPSVVLDLDSMVVADAGVVTAGAAFAHIDLALALVRRVSPGLAGHVARLLVIDERAAQSAYLVTDYQSQRPAGPCLRAAGPRPPGRGAGCPRACGGDRYQPAHPRATDPGRARHEPTGAGAAPAGRARRPSAAHHGAKRRADRAAGGLRQCVHPPCPAAASPDGPASGAIARGHDPSHVQVSAARFTPSARTAWHTHAAGQTLYITGGHGLHRLGILLGLRWQSGLTGCSPPWPSHSPSGTPAPG